MMPEKTHDEKDDSSVELPEDRLEMLGKEDEPKGEAGEPRRKTSTDKKGKQAKAEKDAPEAPAQKEPKLSREDLLAEVRQSLLEDDETVEEEPGLFGRIKGMFSKSKQKEADKPILPVREAGGEVEIQEEEVEEESILESAPKKEGRASSKKEQEAIQEFFADLEALATVEPDPEVLEVETEQQQEEPEKLPPAPRLPKKSEDKDEIDLDKVRGMALEEYDETIIEPEYVSQKPLQEEVRETIREARPLEKILIAAAVVITVGALLFAGVYVITNTIQESIPTPTPVVTPDLSEWTYPTRITLPGGWKFDLGQGQVYNGVWTPQGAEWLIGTEISRWVALPWNVQLEAVLRTLKSDDVIEVMMSNFDVLTYGVYSIEQMSMEQILALDPRKPSLVVVLYNSEGSDGMYWVVTALPMEVEPSQ